MNKFISMRVRKSIVYLSVVAILLMFYLVLPINVFARTCLCQDGGTYHDKCVNELTCGDPKKCTITCVPNPTLLENIGELLSKLSAIVPPFAVLGFVASVIYAGFIRMTAAGNAEKESKSMKIAIAAAVGFAIIALAIPLVNLLSSFLGVKEPIV